MGTVGLIVEDWVGVAGLSAGFANKFVDEVAVESWGAVEGVEDFSGSPNNALPLSD